MNTERESVRRLELDQLQRWLQAVITHSGGIGPGLVSTEAQSYLQVEIGALEVFVAPSATLSGAAGLGIYYRSYYARLLQCLQSMFPVLFCALGDDLFNRFALDYLEHYPPHSYSLHRLADAFPQYLAETRPDADAPPEKRESWPDFVIDLASLELAFFKVYDGPGVEGRPIISVRDIVASSVEHILEIRPIPVPCLRLFTFRYPVHSYLLAARRGETPELPAPSESFVAMTRKNYRVVLYGLSSSQYALLKGLDGKHTLAHVLNQGGHIGNCGTSFLVTARDWLCDWVGKGLVEVSKVGRHSEIKHGAP